MLQKKPAFAHNLWISVKLSNNKTVEKYVQNRLNPSTTQKLSLSYPQRMILAFCSRFNRYLSIFCQIIIASYLF